MDRMQHFDMVAVIAAVLANSSKIMELDPSGDEATWVIQRAVDHARNIYKDAGSGRK